MKVGLDLSRCCYIRFCKKKADLDLKRGVDKLDIDKLTNVI